MKIRLIEERKSKILKFISLKEYSPMSGDDIAKSMDVPDEEKGIFDNLLYELESLGKIIKTDKGKIILSEKLNLFEGVFHGTEKGFGFVSSERFKDNDIFVKASNKNGAVHMDKVLIKVDMQNKTEKRAEGIVVKIIKRGLTEIVGTFQAERSFGFVIPDDKKIGYDIYISKKDKLGAVNGHKVVVKIIKPPLKKSNPEGKIIEILGHINDPGVDILSILRKHEVSTDFSGEIYSELEAVEGSVTEKDCLGREDLRSLQMFTIDGDDSKDLDDAVSIQSLESGNFRLGVHIADVSHYVAENSLIEKEAYKRGTSIYLVDRVVPMLPHKLSNGICSLNEQQDRLALSCIMEIDSDGNVVNHRIFKSIINVNKRMTYNIVNDLLENENSQYSKEYGNLIPSFKQMKNLADIIRSRRIQRGAIEFDFPETKIIVDENGKPVDIKPYNRNCATGIIEEFMIICNETIAEHFFWLELPFVYRIHEKPDKEKLEKLLNFVGAFGYTIRGKKVYSKSIQDLLNSVQDTPEEMIINRIVLRSLKQARYFDQNIGHFGLAAKYYCHFTSPIRRYPDLQIHRIIKKYIDDDFNKKYLKYLNKNISKICLSCSVTERTAENIEREVNTLKKVEYMLDKEGMEFKGIISGVTGWGIYVELHNTVEGMVSINKLNDDNYIFNPDAMTYTGQHTNKVHKIGNIVNIKVDKVNLREKNIDFIFL